MIKYKCNNTFGLIFESSSIMMSYNYVVNYDVP